jgi:polyisoprenoid-binding protein YceI
VVLDVEYEGWVRDMRGGTRSSFTATTEIDREEFGITWNVALETGGVLVSKKVKIEHEVAAVLPPAQQAA